MKARSSLLCSYVPPTTGLGGGDGYLLTWRWLQGNNTLINPGNIWKYLPINMKIAYIILAHKYPEQLIRLILRLNTESTHFFLHIDKKTSHEIYSQILNSLSHLPNIFFLDRHNIYWGEFSIVKAIIEGIKTLFNLKISVDYVILLTGQDYPLKSNIQIKTFLKEHEGKSFISYFPLPHTSGYQGWMYRIERWNFRLFNKRIRLPNKYTGFIPKRKFPKNFKPFAGYAYWCLSQECIEYIHNFINQNSEFVNYYKFVEIPDEGFFQTILLNSPLKDKIINDDLRYIKWVPEAAHPLILGQQDFEEMMSSSKLFARKFALSQDAKVLDLIDKKILNET